jgi:predicted TIM-barrel fold metal-dependent hydrolase
MIFGESKVIIDCHCHAGKGDGLTGPWDTDANLDKYLAHANKAGIAKTVIWSAINSNYQVGNRQVGNIVKNQPDRFIGFAFVNSRRDRFRIRKMVEETILNFGFCGIKVHRYDAPISREVCEIAKTFKLPVVYDVMGEVSQVELLASEYPSVNFIIPHLGSFSDEWKSQLALIDHLVRHPNIFTDTSGVRRFELLQQTVQRAGAKKLLFGSDGPWLHPGIELAKVKELNLNDAEERLVLGGNILRLIGPARSRRIQIGYDSTA